jgi:hypothetical protein
VLVTGQFKRMTPELRDELVRVFADLLVAELQARPPVT